MRQEIFDHHEELWVLCLADEGRDKRFSPLIDLVDWYNNSLITKSVIDGKISLDLGHKTLMTTTGLMPAQRLLIFGLGSTDSQTESQGSKVAHDLGQALEELQVNSPWVIISEGASDKFVKEFQKSRSSMPRLAHSKVSVDKYV